MESDLFSNLEEISANENYCIYRATRTTDSFPVILKKIKDNSKRKNLRERLLNEREIATIISKPWADRVIDFLEEPEVALVFQDGGEISLRQFYSGKIQNPDEFLDFSISISKKLFQIHEKKILHRDIKPSNILYDKIKKDYILIDFGLSRKHSRNFSEDNRSILEGTPEFISPEATGRTGNSEDYRSDLYSLGITFYELLTGRLPFLFEDPLKLIHAHLATPAHFLEEDSLYPILKKVILKLLEKSPSLRYQSAYGLCTDLLKIKDCPIANRNELNFPLGEEDSSMDFILPKKLYGRENEISLLLRNFETIKSGEVRTTLIAGFSGIGKSALINVLQAPISENKGYFLSGKFEQYKQNTPFFAILQILRNFLRLLYLEKEDIVVRIQNKIIESLGEIGGVITKLLPEYENFLGEQSILPELPPSQESNRFRLGLERLFLGITGDIPLVFFMDDLQWADSASLEILKNLLQSSDLRSIYFLFAYRNNEVDETHPFRRMLQELNKEGIHPETILIEPLSLVSTNELISDALRRKKEETEDLTWVVHSRTEGNPFFIHQFLYSLYDKNIIVLHKNHYIYSLSCISSMQVEDSVVDLMLGRIEKLPPDSREILSAVSCMGSSVEFMHLYFVLQISNLPELLSPILEEGFFIKNKFFRGEEEILELKFSHDRIQEAAYKRWEDSKKVQIHYRTGLLFLEKLKESKDVLFGFLEQWNACPNLLSLEEKEELFRRNLEGAIEAKTSSAYEGSLKFLRNAFSLLDLLDLDSPTLLSLYLERGEVESLNFRYEEGEIYFQKALELCVTRLDRLRVYEKIVYFLSLRGEYDKSIENAIKIMKEFDDRVKFHFKKSDLFLNFKEIDIKFKELNLDRIINNYYNDIEIILYFDIINIIINSAYYSNISLINEYFFSFSIIQLLKYGLTKNNSNLLASLTIYLATNKRYKDTKNLINYLFHNYINNEYVMHILFCFIYHNFYHLKFRIDIEKNNINYLILCGSIDKLGPYIFITIANLFSSGTKVVNLKNEIQYYITLLDKFKNINFKNIILEYQTYLIAMEKEKILDIIQTENNTLRSVNLYLITLYLFRVNEVLNYEHILEFNKYRESIKYTYIETEFDFYHALILIRDSRASEEIYSQNSKKIQSFLTLFEEKAELCPDNNLHKLLLIQAELAYTQKEYWKAMELYDKSIASAREFQFLNNSTLALERASIFYEEIQKPILSQAYLLEAIQENEKWGATGRVTELRKKIKNHPSEIALQREYPSSQTTIQVNIDSLTLIKASRILSEERNLSILLTKFLEIILENSGAEWAMYLEYKDKNWVRLESTKPEESKDLPLLPFQFLEKSKEPLVLQSASTDPNFSREAYFQSRSTKSVLVLPILYKGEMIGSVYMENNLSEGVFTKDRVALLGVLGSGAASFIENARAFQKVEELSQELQRQNEVLQEQKQRATKAYLELEVSQKQLVQADKMITLGTMVAGVAHEINTPLGAIKASGENIGFSTNDLLESMESFFTELNPKDWSLIRNTVKESLQKNKTLSSKEQRAIKKGLKAELENIPELDIDSFCETIMDLGLFDSKDTIEKLTLHSNREKVLNIIMYFTGILKKSSVVHLSADRVSKIVKSLKSYMHFDTSDEMQPAYLPETLETVLTILHSKLKHGIDVHTHYDEMPSLYCFADELSQIFTNLIHNSIQAMEGRGSLNIEIKLVPVPDQSSLQSPFPDLGERKSEFIEKYTYEQFVSISIEDSGPGIPIEIQKKIFEPFFTTKKAGEGSGLGLHIIRKILDKHGGYLELYSVPGCTKFTVLIPARLRGIQIT